MRPALAVRFAGTRRMTACPKPAARAPPEDGLPPLAHPLKAGMHDAKPPPKRQPCDADQKINSLS